MTKFYKAIEKLREVIENEIIDTMVQNGLTEFRFERPMLVGNSESVNAGSVYKLALDVNSNSGNNMLLIYSTWGDWKTDNYDDGVYYSATDYFIEDLCAIHQLFFNEINRQKNIDTNGKD